MKLLAGTTHDPATRYTIALSNRVMTALDTTNLRLIFTAPESGRVMVRIAAPMQRTASKAPVVLLGVLEGTTVRARVMVTQNSWYTQGFTTHVGLADAFFAITGLTPGQSYTWDAAVAVPRNGDAGVTLGWGGPNDTTQTNAHGACQFEVWDPGPALVAALTYDPPSFSNINITSSQAMTAFGIGPLTFVAPDSGRVMVRIHVAQNQLYGGPVPGVFLGVLDGATLRARVLATGGGDWSTSSAYTAYAASAAFPVLGLTPGQSYTWDAAYGIERSHWGGYLQWGGPNASGDSTSVGAFLYEIWEA